MYLFVIYLFLFVYRADHILIGDCNTCLFTQSNYSTVCPSNNTLHCSAAKANCQSVSGGCILEACLFEPLVLGITGDPLLFHATFATSNAIQQFLPTNGTPSIFTGNTINPLTTPAGVFAGELLVTMLNFEFFPVKFLRFSSNCSSVLPIFYNMTLETLIYISNYVISGDTSLFVPEITPESLTHALFIYNNAKVNATFDQCFICSSSSIIIKEPTVEPSIPSSTGDSNGNTSILIVVIVVVFLFILIIVIMVSVLVYIMKKRSPLSPPKLANRFK